MNANKIYKHTPGPWFISYTHDDNLSMSIDDQPGMDGERNYDLAVVTHGCPDELLANARLVAAAPVLLSEAKALLKVLRSMAIHPSHYANMEAAIALASAPN
ncbi:hypothetical protein [Limnobacter sp.]|uniref:hypothetical protein n=1 Tax=Limnobacter sp. TaxID=2003368 RepID=UPI00311DBFE5